MQNGMQIDIPLTVDLHVEKFSGGRITQCESCATNIVYEQYSDGRWYVTQRPGVNQFEDASVVGAGSRGRGVYYWDAAADKYIVNSGTVYKSSYAGAAMSITNGTARVFMGEVGAYLVIIDYENDQGWTINSGAPAIITQITDTDFTGLTFARGGCVLNGKLYLLTTTGEIVESGIENPTTWDPLSFRDAEVEPDKGVYMAKHHEHVVVFGSRTTEFFYDAANATGSTLSSRQDVFYHIGMVDADASWQIGDNLYFVGQDSSGSIGVYLLSNFQINKISKENLDTFLTSSVITDGVGITMCGMVSGGRELVSITMHDTLTDLIPVHTIVYSRARGWWGFWDVQLPDVDYFPLVSWTPATTTRAGEGILLNGDLITMLDDYNPFDSVSSSAVYEFDVYESGVYAETDGGGEVIPFEIITGVVDLGTTRRKRQGDLYLIHTPTETSGTVNISTADEQNIDYELIGTVDTSDSESRLNRMGSFRRRNFKIDGVITDQVRMEKMQTTARIG